MSNPIVFISRNRIKPGKVEDFRKHYGDSVPITQANKPNMLVQLAYEFIEPVSVEILGAPSEFALAMMKKIAGAGIAVSIHPQFIGGLMRLKSE
jgi:hypothetical protein